MPVSLASIAANTASVTLKVGEDSVTIVYYPGRLTEKTLADMQILAGIEEGSGADSVIAGFASMNDVLAHLIKSWDVYEDEAQTVMFPIEASRLAELPVFFRTQVFNAILSDIRPETIAPQTQNS